MPILKLCDIFYACSTPSNLKQERQCTHSVTERRVRVTIVTVGERYVENIPILCVCVCDLSYPGCAMLYCQLWTV